MHCRATGRREDRVADREFPPCSREFSDVPSSRCADSPSSPHQRQTSAGPYGFLCWLYPAMMYPIGAA